MRKLWQLFKQADVDCKIATASMQAQSRLSEAELDQVAAAGSKPGGTGEGVSGFLSARHDALKPHP